MSNLRRAQRAAVAAAGLGVGLLICLGTTAAREAGPSPAVAAPFKSLKLQMASIAPFEAPRNQAIRGSAEPFGLKTSPLAKGGLQQKWSGVNKKLPREALALMRCRAHPDACEPAAKRFLAIIDKAAARQGWTRIA